MHRFRWISAIALGLLTLTRPISCQISEAAQGPAARLLNSLVDVVSAGDSEQIGRFVRDHFDSRRTVRDSWPTPCCEAGSVSRTLMNMARRSKGLTIDSIQAQSSNATAFLKTRADGATVYLSVEVRPEQPDRISNYQVMLQKPEPQDLLPASMGSRSDNVHAILKALRVAESRGLFAGTLLIAKAGKPILAEAYGEADMALHRPNRMETPFGLASMGKLFTSVAVAQLVAQGKLDYDQPILRYLPDYPNREIAAKITLRQLLTHRSGLTDIFAKEKPTFPLLKLRDYYPLFANEPLLFEPGKGQQYSNTGFLVASMIVEQVSGEEFRDYLKQHIFEPAGMKHTSFTKPATAARPYAKDFGDDPLNPDTPWVSAEAFYKDLLGGPAAGPGGEYSTAPDLFRFGQALQSGRLLGRKEFSTLIQDGLGCQCSAASGKRIFSHGGGGPGTDTRFTLYVDQDWVVVLLSNYSPPFPQQMMEQIEKILVAK